MTTNDIARYARYTEIEVGFLHWTLIAVAVMIIALHIAGVWA